LTDTERNALSRCWYEENISPSLSKEADMDSGEREQVSAYSCSECGSVVLDDRRRECCGEEMNSIEMDAVSRPELESLLPQVFDISQRGIDIAVYLMDEGQATTDDISTALDINRTTVSRQLNQLRELGVVEYGEQSLKEGGRVHVYTPASLEKVRRRHREGFLDWATTVLSLLDEIDQQKLAAASEYEPASEQSETR
jgi:predicted transcriptional regulator